MSEIKSQSDTPTQIDLEEYIAEKEGKPYTPGPRQAVAFGEDGSPIEQMHKRIERDYQSLKYVLDLAYHQAAYGKGRERHANEKPFDQQPIMEIAAAHGVGFLLGQAAKKMQEAQGMAMQGKYMSAKFEILGAIVYLAATHIHMTEEQQAAERNKLDLPVTAR